MPLSDALLNLGDSRGHFRLVVALLALLLGVALPMESRAQRESGSVTVGFEVGHLGGATAKLYRPNTVAYSTLLTTDGDDFFALYLHRLRERPLADSLLHIYYGPGLNGGGRQLDTAPTVQAGVSAQVGLNFYNGRFEVFLHATPILRLHPSLTPRLAGSVGLRYDLVQPD
jgi:hypothetical protein